MRTDPQSMGACRSGTALSSLRDGAVPSPPSGLQSTGAARTLAHVLLDIAAADRAWRRTWAWGGGDGDESDALDLLEALRDEATTMIEAATGVSWNQIEGANL